jgi:hypothetical protein
MAEPEPPCVLVHSAGLCLMHGNETFFAGFDITFSESA